MFLSRTVSGYLGRNFAVWFAIVLATLFAVFALIDIVELLRRSAGKPLVTLAIIADMELLRLPNLLQEAVPFAVLFGGMFAFVKLTRHHELIVLRAAGVSVWQFLLPALLIATTVGAIKVMALNPLAAVLLAHYERMEGRYLSGKSALLAVANSGLWLREVDANGNHTVVAAKAVRPDQVTLDEATFYVFEGEDQFLRRIDARTARLEPGHWLIEEAIVRSPQSAYRPVAVVRLPTDLTTDKIQESFASPKTVSFWHLPRFIRVLEETGFSATPHRLRWHALMAEPLLLMAMVLLAATFSLRLQRRGGTLLLVGTGVLAGFLLHVMTNVIHALGIGASVPVVLAAWAPAGVSLMAGLSLLLHLEDG
ncbi:MAG: LPS export ABC transporter permease LptG [Alphaproteobacteria bacterium]